MSVNLRTRRFRLIYLVFIISASIYLVINSNVFLKNKELINEQFSEFRKINSSEIKYIEIQEVDISSSNIIHMVVNNTNGINHLFLCTRNSEEFQPSHPGPKKEFNFTYYLRNNNQYKFYLYTGEDFNNIMYIKFKSLTFVSKDLYKYFKENLKMDI